ncbi:MAG: AraC family transcriptional regulator [Ornithinimicrobium sp.]
MGPLSRPWRPERRGVRVLGVRLASWAGRAVAGQSLAGWRDARAPLSTLWGQSACTELMTRIADAGTARSRTAVLASAAEVRASSVSEGSEVVRLAELVDTGWSVADISATMGTTPRQVHRRCTDLFGLPPSVLRRISRLHTAASSRGVLGRVTLADIAYASGYADQSHMAREVRALTGQPLRPAFR